MSEPDAIEPDDIAPEPVPAAPPAGRRRRAVVAGVAVLALAAGGLAVATGGGGGGPKAAPLALLAGNGNAAEGRSTAAPMTGGSGGGAAPAVAGADGRAIMPYPVGGPGLQFKVSGDLPGLAGHAAAWNVSGPALDRAAVTRLADALGVGGTPAARDGGWFADDGDWTLAATPAGDAWSVSLYRSRYGAVDNGASSSVSSGPATPASVTTGGGDAAPAGAGLTAARAEQRVRDLIAAMGAPGASWQAQVTETGIGPGWACAAPAQASPELTREEADKLRLEQNGATVEPAPPAAAGSGQASPGIAVAEPAPAPAGPAPAGPAPAPTAKPGAGGAVDPGCPPPPPPVKGFSVSLFPVLDGHRADWALWNVTLRADDGRIENVYGSWATFDRAGDYKLRTVGTALEELTAPPVALPAIGPAVATPAIAPPAGCAGGAPLAPEKPTASSMPVCPPVAPMVVTITDVELGLVQAPVWDGGRARMMLVPAYRFRGHFDDGSAWETSVIALHPDAIAPPPDVPAGAGGRKTG